MASMTNRTWSRRAGACVLATALVAVATAGAAAAGGGAPASAAAATGEIRLDRVGYLPGAAEVLVMTSRAVSAVVIRVRDGRGVVVADARTANSAGAWSKAFPDVYRVVLPTLRADGWYTVETGAGVAAAGVRLRIAGGQDLYTDPLDATVAFLRNQRDGADVVPGPLDRQPSHLLDAHATAYAPPTYDANDTLVGSLQPVGGPVDASGGWFDAGDYIKLVQTASYTDTMLFVSGRSHPGDAALRAEALHGLDWLGRMWDDRTRTLYYQVGMGDADWPRIVGDHDVWRLPQADDKLHVAPGDPMYFLKYRPVFRAGPAGSLVSPNLAGRLASSFALAAQLMATSDPSAAKMWLGRAHHVLALANTHPAQLLTASPHDYYPESSWRDDLELGWTEVAAADRALRLPATADLRTAARWADARLRSSEPKDTLNLYDVSALAHAELLRLMAAGTPAGLAVTAVRLRDDLDRQLEQASAKAARNAFGLGLWLAAGDPSPHAFGLGATALLAGVAPGPLAAVARDAVHYGLGANPWGTTFVIGVGTVFPHCPQDQIANLSGHLDGTPPLHLGGVTDGPGAASDFVGLGIPAGARACSVPGFAAFDGRGFRYEDDVRAWPSVEPADDYTATALLAFALGSA
jgi:endoglucanase